MYCKLVQLLLLIIKQWLSQIGEAITNQAITTFTNWYTTSFCIFRKIVEKSRLPTVRVHCNSQFTALLPRTFLCFYSCII